MKKKNRKLKRKIRALRRQNASLSSRLMELDPVYRCARKLLAEAADTISLDQFAKKRTLKFHRPVAAAR